VVFWSEDYEKKQTDAKGIAQLIRSGDTIGMGHAMGAPSPEVYHAILDRHEELEGVKILDVVQIRPTKLYDPEYMAKLNGKINHVIPFGVASIRKMYAANRSDFLVGSTVEAGEVQSQRIDVLIIMVTPPNKSGYVNLGLSNFMTLDNIRRGKASGKRRLTIAEVNEQMPVVFGDNWAHVSEFDYFFENSTSIPTFERGQPSDIEQTMANYVLELIRDGDTIQMGIGGIPEAVVAGLDGKHDLGVLTEMTPMGLPNLVEKGVITNNKKPFHPGVTLSCFCMGDQEMYDYARENPACQIYPASYTNDPFFIAQHPNIVTMNMALQIDLSGQIASEGLGHKMISGPGGQLDFMIGSYYSKGGRGITLLNAARQIKGELNSAIVSELDPGTPVTVPRTFAQYVISEYGIASLRYKTRIERAKELIAIAHPDVRGELRNSLNRNFYPNWEAQT